MSQNSPSTPPDPYAGLIEEIQEKNMSVSAQIPSNATEINTPQKPPRIRFSNTLNLTKFNTTMPPNTIGTSPSYKKSNTPPRSALKQRYKPYGGRHTRKRRIRRTRNKRTHRKTRRSHSFQ